MLSDEDLLGKWRAGDLASGEELFRRHFRTVRVYFANKVDDRADLEELVQATFVACVEARDRFEGRASFKTYVLGIARYLLYRYWHQRGRRRVEDIEDLSLADLGAGPSSLISRSETEGRLLQALRQLPLKHQEVLEMYYWEGMTGPDLAIALNLTEDGARSRVSRAKQLLKKELNRLETFAGLAESSDEDLDGWARRVRGCITGLG